MYWVSSPKTLKTWGICPRFNMGILLAYHYTLVERFLVRAYNVKAG